MFPEFVAALLAVALTVGLVIVLSTGIIRSTALVLPRQDCRLGHLDGLRGLLALMVLVHHYAIWVHFGRGAGWVKPDSAFFSNLGHVGVCLFFMTSAALFYDRVTQPMNMEKWVAIFISRFFRIVPLYWLAVVIVIGLFAIQGFQFEPGDASRVSMWFLFRGTPAIMGEPVTGIPLNVAWTLKYEWMFYASLPLIWFVGLLLRGGGARLSLLVFGTFIAIVLSSIFPGNLILVAPFFLFGMIAVELKRIYQATKLLSSWPVGVIGTGCLVISLSFEWKGSSQYHNLTLLLLMGAAFLSVYFGSPALSVLRRRPLVALGEWSFGIYLLHNTVHYLTFMLLGLGGVGPAMAWYGLPVSALVTVLLAAAAHVGVEKPFIRLGCYLSKRRTSNAPMIRVQPS